MHFPDIRASGQFVRYSTDRISGQIIRFSFLSRVSPPPLPPPPCLRFHCFLPPLSPFVSISFSIYSLSYLYISDTSRVFDTAEISRENFIADTLDEAGFVREIDLSEEENEWPGFDFLVTAINRSVIVPT